LAVLAYTVHCTALRRKWVVSSVFDRLLGV
jgi:hypothetical protein